jgi:hypothetical protein
MACKADNHMVICGPTVQKMWKPWCLTILRASTVCYKSNFTFYLLHIEYLIWHILHRKHHFQQFFYLKYYIVASCCTFHSITISSLSCVQTLVSSSHSHLTFLKLLKFLKVLKNTTCFGQYGYPQVLNFLVGETAAILLLLYVSLRCASMSCLVCCAPCCSQLSVLFLNAKQTKRAHWRDTYNSSKVAEVSTLKIVTPEDGHISWNM